MGEGYFVSSPLAASGPPAGISVRSEPNINSGIIHVICVPEYVVVLVALFAGLFETNAQDRRIFVGGGGDIDLKFTRYVADLTGKEKPCICYVPMASGDHSDNINYWSRICHTLDIDTLVLRVWVSNLSGEPLLRGAASWC